MVMQQVLVDKQRLRTIIRSQNDIIAQLEEHVKKLQQENADKDKTIERLKAENNLFRTTSTQPQIVHMFTQPQNNTIYNVQGDYIANDKHVGAHIDNVQPGAIGTQTTKD